MTATLQMPQQAQMAQQPKVFPMAGESQGQFFDRASRALKSQFPKVNQRTVQIIRLWQQSDNDSDLRQEAQDRFPSDKFTQYGPRCVFLSHTIPQIAEEVDETGEVVQPGREGTEYNRENLQHLVDYANYRIRNAGQFAALSEGHMPTLEEKSTGREDAAVLGYAGPFYLGLFGNENPQWAIFCDEWVHNEDVAKAEKLQRRSPEIWCKEPIERRTMDPIAMLGSETPRLDSGMNLYAKRADGQEVMRYSMSMALPNSSNTYVPGSESGHKQKYGADMFPPNQDKPADEPKPDATVDPATPDESDETGQGDNDPMIDAVVQAIAGLMPNILQAVQDSMNQGNPDDPEAVPQGDANPAVDPSADVPRGIDPAPDAGQPPAPAAQATPPATPNPAQAPAANAAAQPIDDKHAQYAAMSPDCGAAYAAGHACGLQKGKPPMTTNYSKDHEALEARLVRLTEQNAAMAEQNKALLTRVGDLETAARDTERYGKIHAIAEAHDIGDEQEVLADIINASDEEFDRYCKVLTKAAKKADAPIVDLYDDVNFDPEKENYSRQHGGAKSPTKDQIDHYCRQAADSVSRKRNRGVETTLDAEMDIVFKAAGLPVPTV